MDRFVESFFIDQNIGYLVFDFKLNLIKISEKFNKDYINSNIKIGENLFDLLPVFFGSDDLINKVQSGKRDVLRLENINIYNTQGELSYVNYYLVSDLENENIIIFLTDSTEKSNLQQKLQQQQNEIKILKESISYYQNNSLESIWGTSAEIEAIKKFIIKVANIKETTILLTGESGTGKTLVAKAIHNLSENSNSPFVEINCASIPETLLESEIFGHVKGAFTNAVENKLGLIEEAEGGTLFLDEIGELPLSLQPKLLSFLETRKIRQVGSTKEISVNTRIITATNKDLKKAISSKEFREDLFYRINVVSFKIPSLKERTSDIISISENFIKILSLEFNKRIIGLTTEAKHKLLNYHWPGNIRELKNIIERALIFCENDHLDHFDLIISDEDLEKNNRKLQEIPDEGISLIDLEKKYIKSALAKSQGNQTNAAKLLGLSLDTFRYRIKKFNIT